jgi:transcriptional regulator of arginine metabolism
VRDRDRRILEIVARREITTQTELVDALRSVGVRITQATVSRDIKRLGLVKTPRGDGSYRYAAPEVARMPAGEVQVRLRRAFADYVSEIDEGSGLVIVKTTTGSASAVAEAIDEAGWPEIVGTVAGDNTILIVPKRSGARPTLIRRLRELL